MGLRIKKMAFIVDCMLGKLAKWLKILGFDTVFFSRIEDNDLIDRARKQGRILLTRDTGIVEKAGNIPVLFIESEDWEEQIAQVLDEFHLRNKARPHTLCIDCNQELKELAKNRAKNLVTPFVYSRADTLALCPACGRVYWRGTHFKDMEDKVSRILKRDEKHEKQ
jgi:uncharacterized protein with PIN domain